MPIERHKKKDPTGSLGIKDLPLLKLFYFTLAINTIILAYVFSIQKKLQPEVPLFYGLPEGQDQLTNPLNLAIPALISFAITGVNFAICLLIKRKFFQQALVVTSFGVSIFLMITIIKITLLIGSY